MAPIPGEPLDPKPQELTTSDGRKVKLKLPGFAPPPPPVPHSLSEEPDDAEPHQAAGS